MANHMISFITSSTTDPRRIVLQYHPLIVQHIHEKLFEISAHQNSQLTESHVELPNNTKHQKCVSYYIIKSPMNALFKQPVGFRKDNSYFLLSKSAEQSSAYSERIDIAINFKENVCYRNVDYISNFYISATSV